MKTSSHIPSDALSGVISASALLSSTDKGNGKLNKDPNVIISYYTFSEYLALILLQVLYASALVRGMSDIIVYSLSTFDKLICFQITRTGDSNRNCDNSNPINAIAAVTINPINTDHLDNTATTLSCA